MNLIKKARVFATAAGRAALMDRPDNRRKIMTKEKSFCFSVSGEEMQQFFATVEEARAAASSAPWADGRVFRHEVPLGDHAGFAEAGEEI